VSPLYKRSDSSAWWFRYKDVNGKWRDGSSGKRVREEAEAELAKLEKEISRAQARRKAAGLPEKGPLTVGGYCEGWLARRLASGLDSAENDASRVRTWVQGTPFWALPLADVRPGHLREYMRWLAQQPSRKGGTLAPRTQTHVYGLLRVMFSDAVAEEVLAANPCALRARRKELPGTKDKDPNWRATAVFAHWEVEQLLSDERVPEDRRVLYAFLFLTGMRVGEAADRRWMDWDVSAKPLGRLNVATSFSTAHKKRKGTKTGVVRPVPVHPTLAPVLAAWRLSGWAAMLGRHPQPEDLIIPSREGRQRRSGVVLRRFQHDCQVLGLRPRRVHDTRRTFVSLATGDGANQALLRWVTHGSPSDQFSQYLTPPWPALCEAVAALKVTLNRDVAAVLLRPVANGGKVSISNDLGAPVGGGGAGAKAVESSATGDASSPLAPDSETLGDSAHTSSPLATPNRSNRSKGDES
jgi:integrase